jgi:CheY-like chemotaxis protein
VASFADRRISAGVECWSGIEGESPPAPPRRGEPEVLPEPLEEIGSNQPPDEPKAGIYPRNPQESLVGSGLSLRVPDAPSLREPLTLARALKPLMRRMPSGSTLVLDEAATTQQIAETGLWLPVLKPTLEPWLDLELVVDEGISMQIWRHTIGELERLLKNYGIFRDVRVWGLIANDSEASDLPHRVQIRRGIGATAKNQALRSPAELIDPSGRRLILVVSDCVSPQWRDGKLTKTLELWAKQGSMAIVQMLPKWLWKRTALGRASEVRLQGLNPGEFNQKLIAKGVSLWDELEETRGVKVPIFTLEPDRVATWAQMLSGKGNTWTAGYVFKLDPLPARQGKDLFNLDVDRSNPEQRVQAFRVTASPMARKLAGLLAAAPVISLPIVQLIQETLLKESQQVHVAEVFLGGLLKPLSEINPETNPNYVQYEFMDGVRELLADSVPSGYVLDVVDAVSKYMAGKVGLSLENFAAVLRNPQQVKDSETADNVSYFATMTAQILRRLGGEYLKFAEELERHGKLNHQEQKTPYTQTSLSEDSRNQENYIVEDRFVSSSSNPTCLLILWVTSGNAMIATMMQRYLEKRLNCKNDIARDGKIALNKISKEDYDIIFFCSFGFKFDIFEAIKKIRRREKGRRHTIIIGLSHQPSYLKEGLEVGMDAAIKKHFEPAEIYHKVLYYKYQKLIKQDKSLSAARSGKRVEKLYPSIPLKILEYFAILDDIRSTNSKKIEALQAIEIIAHEDEQIKEFIIIILGALEFRVNRVIDWIMSELKSNQNSSTIKKAAVKSLGKIIAVEDREAISAMETALKNEKVKDVRDCIQINLHKIDPNNKLAAEYRAKAREIKSVRK